MKAISTQLFFHHGQQNCCPHVRKVLAVPFRERVMETIIPSVYLSFLVTGGVRGVGLNPPPPLRGKEGGGQRGGGLIPTDAMWHSNRVTLSLSLSLPVSQTRPILSLFLSLSIRFSFSYYFPS